MDFHRSLEMSLSREEFFRLLPAAVGSFEADGETIRWSEGACGGTIRLVPLSDRRLGGVVMPRHRIDIEFDAPTEADADAFMVRLHRGFLRGGG